MEVQVEMVSFFPGTDFISGWSAGDMEEPLEPAGH